MCTLHPSGAASKEPLSCLILTYVPCSAAAAAIPSSDMCSVIIHARIGAILVSCMLPQVC